MPLPLNTNIKALKIIDNIKLVYPKELKADTLASLLQTICNATKRTTIFRTEY